MTTISGIDRKEAETLMRERAPEAIYELIYRAGKVRQQHCGNRVHTCAIVNAKSGNCGENCAFCPQSVHASSQIDKYPLKSSEELMEKAIEAETNHACSFGIVTSGRAVRDTKEIEVICRTISAISTRNGIGPCVSLGTVSRDCLKQLKAAGCQSYHHNLETSAGYYPKICTTRTFEDNVRTVKDAKEMGFKVCSGGLFGMGESDEQRVDLLATLREIEVDSVPVNFLNPIPGTRISNMAKPMSPLECLKIIAVARLMLPAVQIRICGGRELNLRDMQSWIFAAGASALMIGSYLTSSGRNVEDDMQMITDAGMVIAPQGGCGGLY